LGFEKLPAGSAIKIKITGFKHNDVKIEVQEIFDKLA
jgi:hypothetical protein